MSSLSNQKEREAQGNVARGKQQAEGWPVLLFL